MIRPMIFRSKMISHLSKVLCLLGMVLALSACEEISRKELYFVGDSIIDMWDTRTCFPSFETHNLGVSGSKLADLEARPLPPAESVVVCQIGTNDLQFDFTTEADRSAYVNHYLEVISHLSQNCVYLYSVLPSVRDGRDRNIPWFNDSIRTRIHEYPHVVYLDVYDRFLDADGKSLQNRLTPDKLHLNDYGYAILTNALQDKMFE